MNYSKFSTFTSQTKGRVFLEKPDKHRTCFMRDRDRIIHCEAFRKLKYKTQVFVYHEGDYYRTRLSHSIEVSQLARSISKIFKVNDDLAEAIALAHDVGHTPFGHAGEEALNNKLDKIGGFNHNFQALKILTLLEKKYFGFDGLNLSWETLEGILKHNGPVKEKIPSYIYKFVNFFEGDLGLNASFEGQIASISDDIAYNNNDIDDGLHAELFAIDELENVTLVKENLKKIKIKNYKDDNYKLRHELVRLLINTMINDLVNNTKLNILHLKPKDVFDIIRIKKNIVSFSNEMVQKEKELRIFLKKKMYNHITVKTMTFKAKKIISELFDLFVEEFQLLPKNWRNFETKNELMLNVADYISGLTDKNAISIHNKFFNLYNI
ncbi:MAG: deoxyguanosinetriphosphate triphosphohydrolase [Rickettsiales bacterium]|nr:deoxyguanosinetriphosphate triphosphohydrolase [Rickettsiales bacterium]